MKSPYLFLLGSVLLGSILLSACETIVEIDIPREAPRLVANAFINPDSLISVRVSRSKFVLDNAPLKPIENATAQIFENGQLRESLEHTGQGLYVSSFKPQVGSEYTLQVAAQGFESIEATSFIRQKVPIQQLAYDTTLTSYGTSCINDSCYTNYSRSFTFDLTLKDDADREDFYAVEVYIDYVYINGYYDHLTGEYITGDTSVYQRPVYLYSTDPALVDPGFADSDEGGTYGQTLLFTDEIFSGKSYTFGFETSDYLGEETQEVTVVLKTLEEAQYRYLRSRELQYQNEGNPFAEPSPVYSNIQNGYGIFAGYSADQRVIQVK